MGREEEAGGVNENDVYLLVRIVRENRHGQVPCKLAKSEGAAARRLVKAGFLIQEPTAMTDYCPTGKALGFIQSALPAILEIL